MNLALWLARSAQRHGARTAIGHGRERWCSYAELAQRAASLAAWLQAQHVTPGDRVGLFLPNRPEYLVMLWGAWWAGAAVVPINAKLHAREAGWILQHSGAKLAFCSDDAYDQLAACAPSTTLHAGLPALGAAPASLAVPNERSDTDPHGFLHQWHNRTAQGRGAGGAAAARREPGLLERGARHRGWRRDAAPAPLSHGAGLYPPAVCDARRRQRRAGIRRL